MIGYEKRHRNKFYFSLNKLLYIKTNNNTNIEPKTKNMCIKNKSGVFLRRFLNKEIYLLIRFRIILFFSYTNQENISY